jgi:hypothetical protein
MDPRECVAEAATAMAQGRIEEALESLLFLLIWQGKGGFMPPDVKDQADHLWKLVPDWALDDLEEAIKVRTYARKREANRAVR